MLAMPTCIVPAGHLNTAAESPCTDNGSSVHSVGGAQVPKLLVMATAAVKLLVSASLCPVAVGTVAKLLEAPAAAAESGCQSKKMAM